MPKDKLKTIYVYTQCGETSPRWLGRCPSCGAWNTMTEDVVAEPVKASPSGRGNTSARVPGQTTLTPHKLVNISTTEEKSRIVTGRELENPPFCCSSAVKSAKPKTSYMSRAKNPSGKSSFGRFVWTCPKRISLWWQKATWMRFAD